MGPACPTPAPFWVPKRYLVLFDKRSHNQTGPQNKRKGGLFYQIGIFLGTQNFLNVFSSVQLQDTKKG